MRTETISEADYRASLDVKASVRRLAPGDPLDRIVELFQRTTQFNTTGRRFGVAELGAVVADPAQRCRLQPPRQRPLRRPRVSLGAVVVCGGEIVGLAVSCRVLGLGAEQAFMREVIAQLALSHPRLTARIVETARNAPVRNVYRDAGFTLGDDGVWRLETAARRSAA